MKTKRVKSMFSWICFVMMTGFTPSLWAQGASIGTVSPSSAALDDPMTVQVSIILEGSPLPPQITSAVIGTVTGTNPSYTQETGEIIASYDFQGETAGMKDVTVTFPTPGDPVTLTKADGFTITAGGGTVSRVYVNASGSSQSPDGTTWETAYQNLQDGIDLASLYGADVWVAQGTYTPTSGSDRTLSIELKSGVSVYGGFSGTETMLSQRNPDPQTNNTVLSGDIGVTGTDTDNSYHVVTGADNSVLDGFTIKKGYADGKVSRRMGGGLYNVSTYGGSGSPAVCTIRNCLFTENFAESGGAMYNYFSAPAISDCIFSSNSANYGGAILLRVNCGNDTSCTDATISNTQFSGNIAEWRGGGVFIDYGASPSFTDCSFSNNSTSGNGGAVYIDDRASQLGGTYPSFSSCAFTGNSAAYRGGAFAAYNTSCYPELFNCTFNGNTALEGGGAIALNQGVVLTLTNPVYSSNSGGTGDADLDYDNTCAVQ